MRRRIILGTALAVAVLGLLGLLAWRVWWPHHRPDLRAGERYGLDVSNHQGEIDWSAAADDGVEFAYIKATEGGDHTDARFEANWADATDSGVEVGAYHFFTLCRSGAAQAAHFLATVPDDADLPPAVDLELQGNCSARPAAADVREEVEAFIDAVEAGTGQDVVLYVLDSWEERYPTRDLARGDRRIWQRRIGPLRPAGDWWLWQFTFEARVDGIDGPVDLNVMRP